MDTEQTLIFSDLDGTLLDHFTYHATAAKDMLATLKNANIPVILNTSKTKAEIEIIQQDLLLDTPFIIENGAAVYIPKGTFEVKPQDTIEEGDYWVKSFCLPREHWLALLNQNTHEFKEYYQGFSTLTIPELCNLTGLMPAEAERAKQRLYGEPVHWFGDKSKKSSFIEKLCELGVTVVSGGRFTHVSGNCNKGQALIWLAECYREHYQNNAISTIALGDSDNDSAMLEAANIAVQIRSPSHDFPTLNRQFNVVQTEKFGPEGWTEALTKLLSTKLSNKSINSEVNHG